MTDAPVWRFGSVGLPGLIVHSDRGSQYAASKAYRRLLAKHGFIGSMSRKEIVGTIVWRKVSPASIANGSTGTAIRHAMKPLQQDVLDYMTMFHNSRRLHLHSGASAPVST